MLQREDQREKQRTTKTRRKNIRRKKQHTCIAANYCATGTEYNRRTTTNAKMYARARAVRRRRRRLMRTPNAQCCEKIKNVYNIILIHKSVLRKLGQNGLFILARIDRMRISSLENGERVLKQFVRLHERHLIEHAVFRHGPVCIFTPVSSQLAHFF